MHFFSTHMLYSFIWNEEHLLCFDLLHLLITETCIILDPSHFSWVTLSAHTKCLWNNACCWWGRRQWCPALGNHLDIDFRYLCSTLSSEMKSTFCFLTCCTFWSLKPVLSSTPHTSHESLFLLTPSASEIMLVVDGEGVSGVLLWETI